MAEQERRPDGPERRADATAAPQMQEAALAQAEAAAEAEQRQADEMPEGGRFIVDGRLVDADGNPIKGRHD